MCKVEIKNVDLVYYLKRTQFLMTHYDYAEKTDDESFETYVEVIVRYKPFKKVYRIYKGYIEVSYYSRKGKKFLEEMFKMV